MLRDLVDVIGPSWSRARRNGFAEICAMFESCAEKDVGLVKGDEGRRDRCEMAIDTAYPNQRVGRTSPLSGEFRGNLTGDGDDTRILLYRQHARLPIVSNVRNDSSSMSSAALIMIRTHPRNIVCESKGRPLCGMSSSWMCLICDCIRTVTPSLQSSIQYEGLCKQATAPKGNRRCPSCSPA